MNRQEAATILRILRSVWPNETVDNDTATAWAWAFEAVPYGVVEDAAKQHIRTGRFFPKPAELLDIIAADAVAPGLVPEAAWTEVLAEVRRVGFGRPPDFSGGRFLPSPVRGVSSPLIAEAVDAVGWRTICTSDDPEEVRDQFVWALKAIAKRAIREVQVTGVATNPAIGAPADDQVAVLPNGHQA